MRTSEHGPANGDLESIWDELRRKRNGKPNYISGLYTNDNDETPPMS